MVSCGLSSEIWLWVVDFLRSNVLKEASWWLFWGRSWMQSRSSDRLEQSKIKEKNAVMEVTFFPCPQLVWTPLLLVWQSLPLHCLCLRLWGQKMIVTGEQGIGAWDWREESVLWMSVRAIVCGVCVSLVLWMSVRAFVCGVCVFWSDCMWCVCISFIMNEC